MHFTYLPDLKHEVVCLRAIEAGDIDDWYNYLSLPAVFEHTSWNVKAASELTPYTWGVQEQTPSSATRFAIALKSTNRLIGTAGFHTVSPINKTAELAYDLTPEFWGQGIATAACRELITWAHAGANVIRLQATVLESNSRSMQVLNRLGFLREGLLHSYRLVRGVPGNFYMYSHLQGELSTASISF